MPRHPLAAALACTLLLAPVVLPAFAAEPDIAAAKVKWDMPWKQGLSLQYATEFLSDEHKDGKRERSRSTDNTTVRIEAASGKGFVQSWTSKDAKYVVLDGESDAAEMKALNAAMAGVPVQVKLDAAGNYAGMHNLDDILPRLRKAMSPFVKATAEKELAKITDKQARAAAQDNLKNAEAMLDRLFTPAYVEAMLSRMISTYNGFVGIELEPDQAYELDTELPNPFGGAPLPAKLTFSLSISADDPEDLFVAYEMTVDPEKMAALALEVGEKLADKKATDEERAGFKSVELKDEGLFVVHRPTGVVEMFEDTRTTRHGTTEKVERHRMRQLDGAHDHVWRDEADAPGAGTGTAEPGAS
jgi:hypothetical protein